MSHPTSISGIPDQPTGGEALSRIKVGILFAVAFACLSVVGFVRNGTAIDELLQDTDDYMRVVQVRELIEGQAWTDTVQRRLDYPEGVRMHWSRLSDLPLAAAIVAIRPVVGEDAAIHLAVAIVPPLLGALFVVLFVWAAAPLSGRGPPEVAVLMIGAVTVPLLQFLPGRVDHHGLQLVFAVAGLGFLFRALSERTVQWALALGLVGGIALDGSLEALPWLGAAAVALTLRWVWGGEGSARTLLAFGATLLATAALAIVAAAPNALWFAVTCDRLSITHVALVALVPVVGTVALMSERQGWARGSWRRFAIAAAPGGIGLALVVLAFPHCALNPYGELPDEMLFWFRGVSEAQPLIEYAARKPVTAVSYTLLPVAAFIYAAYRWKTVAPSRRAVAAASLILVAIGLGLMAWEVRGYSYAGLFAGLALVPLASKFDARADEFPPGLARMGVRLLVPLGAVLTVMIPTAAQHLHARTVAATLSASCNPVAAIAALNDPARLGAGPLTLAAPIDLGPRLLFATHHRVLAAPYHRDVRGMVDNRRIFAGTEADALATIRRRGVGAVLYCADFGLPPPYQGQAPFLIQRLAAGAPPAWLTPVVVEGGLGLYRVNPPAGGAP